LLDRKVYELELDKRVDIARRYEGRQLIYVIIDFDHFSGYNNIFGHKVGDEVLKLVAGVLIDSFRLSDAIIRYGGEEIVVLLSGIKVDKAEERVNIAAEEIRGLKIDSLTPDKIQEDIKREVDDIKEGRTTGKTREQIHSFIVHQLIVQNKLGENPDVEALMKAETEDLPYQLLTDLVITFSAGLAFYYDDMQDPRVELHDNADKALYEAKKRGRNTVVVFGKESSHLTNPTASKPVVENETASSSLSGNSESSAVNKGRKDAQTEMKVVAGHISGSDQEGNVIIEINTLATIPGTDRDTFIKMVIIHELLELDVIMGLIRGYPAVSNRGRLDALFHLDFTDIETLKRQKSYYIRLGLSGSEIEGWRQALRSIEEELSGKQQLIDAILLGRPVFMLRESDRVKEVLEADETSITRKGLPLDQLVEDVFVLFPELREIAKKYKTKIEPKPGLRGIKPPRKHYFTEEQVEVDVTIGRLRVIKGEHSDRGKKLGGRFVMPIDEFGVGTEQGVSSPNRIVSSSLSDLFKFSDHEKDILRLLVPIFKALENNKKPLSIYMNWIDGIDIDERLRLRRRLEEAIDLLGIEKDEDEEIDVSMTEDDEDWAIKHAENMMAADAVEGIKILAGFFIDLFMDSEFYSREMNTVLTVLDNLN
jgi:diguanylate cyclase (GGDEF)-like protein